MLAPNLGNHEGHEAYEVFLVFFVRFVVDSLSRSKSGNAGVRTLWLAPLRRETETRDRVGLQPGPRLYEGLQLGFQFRDQKAVVGRAADGRASVQQLQLLPDFLDAVGHLASKRRF
jgi:hypothetical protein